MRSDRITELIRSATEQGINSPYLESLQKSAAERRRQGQLRALQQEILGEMAASLGRAEERINVALVELALIAKRIDGLLAVPAAERDEPLEPLLEQERATRKEAERRLWELSVQREALGLIDHRWLNARFVIPPPRG